MIKSPVNNPMFTFICVHLCSNYWMKVVPLPITFFNYKNKQKRNIDIVQLSEEKCCLNFYLIHLFSRIQKFLKCRNTQTITIYILLKTIKLTLFNSVLNTLNFLTDTYFNLKRDWLQRSKPSLNYTGIYKKIDFSNVNDFP